MGRSKFSFLFVVSASLFVATTGASVLRGAMAPPPPQEATHIESAAPWVASRDGRKGAVEAIAPVSPVKVGGFEAAAMAEGATGIGRAAEALSPEAAIAVPPLPAPPAEQRTAAMPPAAGEAVTVALTDDKPLPQPLLPPKVTPPAEPKPVAYKPHPGLWEKPVDIRARNERPRPLRFMLTPAEKELLAHLIYAEAGTEPYEGQVAVAAVVLNRLASPHFPSTVEGIVFEPRAFQPVSNGQLWRGTSETARRALEDALRGWDPTNGALYFYNPRLVSPNNWIRTRKVVRVIGQHHFAI